MTTIPIPSIRGYGRGEPLTKDRLTPVAYLILDYIPGRGLDVRSLAKDTRQRRDYFYSQLIDILAQMRQLEFPSAGTLMLDSQNKPGSVLGPLCSRSANELHVQGTQAISPTAPFKTTTDFVLFQLGLITESCRPPLSEQSLQDAQFEVFALCHLKKVLHEFTSEHAGRENGPFVLSHLDLRGDNIIVDDDLNILAVIDWEWTGTIPSRLFIPPYWLAGRQPPFITGKEYRQEFAEFHRVLQSKSSTSEAHRKLVQEWDIGLASRIELPIAELLQHHSQLVDLFYLALYPRLFQAPRQEVVSDFFERNHDSELAREVQQKVECSWHYTQYLKDHGLLTLDQEVETDYELWKHADKLRQVQRSGEEGPPK